MWFPHSTSKYSFLVWVAMKNRFQTCDRMQQWNNTIDVTCVLCKEAQETCQHLFFGCGYSGEILKEMVGGILKGDFTTDWGELIPIISNPRCSSTEVLLLRYTFQIVAHTIWRERNARRHGEEPNDEKLLTKLVDKIIRLKLLSVKETCKRYLEE